VAIGVLNLVAKVEPLQSPVTAAVHLHDSDQLRAAVTVFQTDVSGGSGEVLSAPDEPSCIIKLAVYIKRDTQAVVWSSMVRGRHTISVADVIIQTDCAFVVFTMTVTELTSEPGDAVLDTEAPVTSRLVERHV
jgi:hypothetical protein